jgi:hypothetical protein
VPGQGSFGTIGDDEDDPLGGPVRPTDEVAADPARDVVDEAAPDDERPVMPPAAGGPGADAVPDDERLVPLADEPDEA